MRSHVVCLPVPVQSHIGAMLKVANILHHEGGLFITFVNTEFNHRRMLHSGGLAKDDATPDFRFLSISDGLPFSDADATQPLHALCDSCRTYMVQPFLDLIENLTEDDDVPPVTHILSDGFMNFITSLAAEKFGLQLLFRADKPHGKIDWIPGMKNMRLCDMPDFFGAGDDDALVRYNIDVMERTGTAVATIINSFEELEPVVLDALSSLIPNVYTIGPLHLLVQRIQQQNSVSKHVSGSLWEEQVDCLNWLDLQEPGSVLYVNFGSIAFLTYEQLVEFAMGLANSGRPFLWVLRMDLVNGEQAILPPGFGNETKDRGFLSGWCPQEKVLNHASVGGFLTHCGWNSILESLSAGVPMICWPSFGDQQTNSRYVCDEWKVGLEVGVDVRRENVEKVIRELLGGETGKELKQRAMEWKWRSAEAVSSTGSSTKSLEKFLAQVFE
ncbi:hypothetical protein MLD38_010166 [Melastoma candidum]|uniref:Uncharacterized protein n=1 Tax=Melastoma candidum TaxID=119954 RepID=A0ACB9QYC2_9MYRT|nr:hypothetical protein MLD38_010166 [Melastoma candidum]